MTNRFPLIVDSVSQTIKELPSGDNLDLTGSGAIFDDITVNGDLTVDTNVLFADAANNRVGIGTSSPTNDLHVSSSSSTKAVFERTGSTGAYIGLKDSSGSLVYLGDNNGTFEVQTAGSSYSTKLAVTSTGKVGIGTSLPQSDLEIQSKTTGTDAVISLTAAGTRRYQIKSLTSVGALAFVDESLASERMRIDSSGNVGIGTSSPTADLSVGSVTSSSGDVHLRTSKTTFELTPSNSDAGGMDINVGFVAGGQGPLKFSIGGSEKMRIDSSGNVGIGTSSALGKFDSYSTTVGSNGWYMAGNFGAPQYPMVRLYAATPGKVSSLGNHGDGSLHFYVNGSTSDIGTYAGQFDSSGNLLVGTTSNHSSPVRGWFAAPSGGIAVGFYNPSTGAVNQVLFVNPNGAVGSIQTNGFSTSYNTSSDYRLKEDVQPMSGASDRVLALNPVNFAWKVDGSRVDGFLAHEVQEFVPEAITGTKDEVDADGNPVYQGIDQSKLTPLLTAALQEALKRIEALEVEMQAMKDAGNV